MRRQAITIIFLTLTISISSAFYNCIQPQSEQEACDDNYYNFGSMQGESSLRDQIRGQNTSGSGYPETGIRPFPAQIGINIINSDGGVNGANQDFNQHYSPGGEICERQDENGSIFNTKSMFGIPEVCNTDSYAINILNINYGNLFKSIRLDRPKNPAGCNIYPDFQSVLKRMADKARKSEQDRKVNLKLIKEIALR